jgi:hypothetical protein
MKNHSLKEGMTLVKPTKEQVEFIFKLAKERGIRNDDSDVSKWESFWFCMHGEICGCNVEGPTEKMFVTFEQFITAMVAPESEPIKSDPIIRSLREENEALKKRLAELEPKVDRRVDFGKSVTFNLNASGNAYIAHGCANDGDSGKVLIPNYKCKWELLPNYYDGRDAVQLVKTN